MRLPAFTARGRFAAIVVGAAVVACVAMVALQRHSRAAADRARMAILDSAGDASLAALLRSWTAEDDGLAFVVDRLADDRSPLAQAAGIVLQEHLTAWQSLRSEDSSPKIAWLAQELAAHNGRFSLAGRRAASAAAQRMLMWPLDEQHVDVLAVYADCDAVLRASAARPNDLLLTAAGDRVPGGGAMMIGRDNADAASGNDIASAVSLPGGGLPWQAIELPPETAPPRSGPVVPPAADEQVPLETPGEIYAPLATPLELLEGKERIDDRTAAAPERAGEGHSATAAALDQAKDWALFELLHDPAAAPEAEAELLRRGHNAQSLAVARKITDDDPHVRRELAERLPQLPGIDPQPWLVQLAHDGDAAVRRTAISILATSGDASVTRWLSELRETESDGRVAALLDELLRRR